MSKERLEALLNNPAIQHNEILWAISYAKEQAERVQELEGVLKSYQTELSIKRNANKRIKKQNKRYRDLFAKILNNECDDSDELADLAEQIAIEALEIESE